MRILWDLVDAGDPYVELFLTSLRSSQQTFFGDMDLVTWKGVAEARHYIRIPAARSVILGTQEQVTHDFSPDLVIGVRFSNPSTSWSRDGPAFPACLLEPAERTDPAAKTDLQRVVPIVPVLSGYARPPAFNDRTATVLFDASDWDAEGASAELLQELSAHLRDWHFEMRGDLAQVAARWASRSTAATKKDQNSLPRPGWRRVDPGLSGVVIVASDDAAWAPQVISAMAEGRSIIARASAEFARYLDGRAALLPEVAWRSETIAEVLNRARLDSDAHAASLRRAAAWARRWSPERNGQALRRAAYDLGNQLGVRPGPSRWEIRREVGIGDIVFSLSVSQAIADRHPASEVVFQTLPVHQEWVSWFEHVRHVREADSADEGLSLRHVDYEALLPHGSERDRTLALGALAEMEPQHWVSRPHLPPSLEEEVTLWLGKKSRPRVGFAPSCAGRNAARSLPREVALAVARGLTEIGEVLWLEQEPLADGIQLPNGVRDLAGRLPVSTVLGVLDTCDLVVSVDSGLLYLAVTLGRPVLGLFTYVGALQRLALAPRFVAVQPSLPCAPCGEGPHASHCRRSEWAVGHPPCVLTLTRAVIAAAARRALECEGREVWNVGPDGQWTVWEPDRLPVATHNLPVLGHPR